LQSLQLHRSEFRQNAVMNYFDHHFMPTGVRCERLIVAEDDSAMKPVLTGRAGGAGGDGDTPQHGQFRQNYKR
jgi:hypothetical protein